MANQKSSDKLQAREERELVEMEKAREKAQEIIKNIIKSKALKKNIKSSTLQMHKNSSSGKSDLPLSLKATSMRNWLKDYEKSCSKNKMPPTLRTWVIRETDSLKKLRSDMVNRLSPNIIKELRASVREPDTINLIADTIIDFELSIKIPYRDIINRLKSFSTNYRTRQNEVTRACEIVLNSGIIDDNERKTIMGIKRRTQQIQGVVVLDELKAMQIIDAFMADEKGVEYVYPNWKEVFFSELIRMCEFKLPCSRPEHFFAKLLQSTVYRIIEEKRVVRYSKEKAKILTAQIIRQCTGMSTNAKRVDNAIHD